MILTNYTLRIISDNQKERKQMKNSLYDLNNHLFCQMERLDDESLSAEEVDKEVKRAKALVGVSDQIIQNAALHVEAAKVMANHGDRALNMMPMIAPKKTKAIDSDTKK
jgi:hypothetical protein